MDHSFSICIVIHRSLVLQGWEWSDCCLWNLGFILLGRIHPWLNSWIFIQPSDKCIQRGFLCFCLFCLIRVYNCFTLLVSFCCCYNWRFSLSAQLAQLPMKDIEPTWSCQNPLENRGFGGSNLPIILSNLNKEKWLSEAGPHPISERTVDVAERLFKSSSPR